MKQNSVFVIIFLSSVAPMVSVEKNETTDVLFFEFCCEKAEARSEILLAW